MPTKVVPILAGVNSMVFVMGCNVATPQPSTLSTATAPSVSSPVPQTSTTALVGETTSTPCPDPTAIKALYDADDASQFDTSLALFTVDATLSIWVEGVNGHHMVERHLTDKEQIRSALGNPGLRRMLDQPDGPIYHEARIQVSGDRVNLLSFA